MQEAKQGAIEDMIEESSPPNLLVVGGDAKRMQWLSHHVTSHWPQARVTLVPAGDTRAIADLIDSEEPDALVMQIDFASEGSAVHGLRSMREWLRIREGLHCIVLAENGDEVAAVRAMKSGARDYLPIGQLTREVLLAAVAEAQAHHGEAAAEAELLATAGGDAHAVDVPGYGIIKQLSTSNFSSVYLARAERLRRNVVLKVMQRGSSARELEDAERFQREYEIISSIAHRAIAEIYDFGSMPQHLYLAMEYFPCGDLRARLRNPLSIAESLYYLRSIAEALRVIHVFGILHRDLKPANVMLREDNAPVLIDFGLARRSMDEVSMTGVGQVLGSPYYMSPEQAQGQRVDARTDLYSLGVMFFEMLTGRKPYVGRSAMAIMTQHANAPVPELPPAAAAQQAVLNRLMAKRPDDRYASADELLADVDPVVSAVA
ncbi:MAG: protein kinase [Gammaproteobacteria bacterium]|nr:protein kinase [Gammaproteobacteria bacterium]